MWRVALRPRLPVPSVVAERDEVVECLADLHSLLRALHPHFGHQLLVALQLRSDPARTLLSARAWPTSLTASRVTSSTICFSTHRRLGRCVRSPLSTSASSSSRVGGVFSVARVFIASSSCRALRPRRSPRRSSRSRCSAPRGTATSSRIHRLETESPCDSPVECAAPDFDGSSCDSPSAPVESVMPRLSALSALVVRAGSRPISAPRKKLSALTNLIDLYGRQNGLSSPFREVGDLGLARSPCSLRYFGSIRTSLRVRCALRCA
jgi:hypothetical protein